MKFKVGDIVIKNPEYFGSGIDKNKGVVTRIRSNTVYVRYAGREEEGEYTYYKLSLVLCSNPNDILKKIL